MALPTIVVPEFPVTIPSTKENVKIRPFLVKEEKVLYMALESNDPVAIQDAVVTILQSCIVTQGIEVTKLASYDIEYLFLQLRSKSVNEEVTMILRHAASKECKHSSEVSFSIDDIEVEFPEGHDPKVDLDNGIGIKFKDPSLADMLHIKETDDEYESILNVIIKCIDVVYDADTVYDEFTDEEAREFLVSLTQTQFGKCKNFFDTLPKLSKKIEWTCNKCGETDSVTLEGMQSFFT